MKPAKPHERSVIERVVITGNHIAVRMKELGLTQEEAARRTGLSVRQLQRAIHGRHNPRLPDVFALALGLETTVEALFAIKVHRNHIRRNGL